MVGNTYSAKITEEIFDFIIWDLTAESTNKNFPMSGLSFFGVYFLVVDCVFSCSHHFIDGVWCLKNNKRKSPGSACVGVSLHINALNLAVRAEVITQLLCK